MAITASLVKELRDKTNAGMMDCKAALLETNGDLEAAADYLRKKGIAKAAKKAEREVKEGVVSTLITEDGQTGVLVEVNCETDFVAKNENFLSFVRALTEHVAGAEPVAEVAGFLAQTSTFGEGTVEETLKAKVAEIGENLVVSRMTRFDVEGTARLGTYIHLNNKVGVLVEVCATKEESLTLPVFEELLKDLTLHIAFSRPPYLKREEVDATELEKEKDVYREQMKDKPAQVIDKIIEGKIGKFYSEICLLETHFIKDNDLSIQDLLQKVGKEIGDTLSIERYACFAVGEK
ncbi:MAG: translation elongation factor Ts [Verrucomicrobiota bacterium]